MERFLFLAVAVVAFLVVTEASLERRQAKAVRPAFSVGLTHNITFDTPSNIPYDRVFTDTTSSYNPQTGEYTIPVSGDYVVMVHALAELDGYLWLEVNRNGDYIFSAYAHTTAQYAAASNVGVASFNRGDKLHIVLKGTSVLYGYPEELYCTLSAYLLSAHKTN